MSDMEDRKYFVILCYTGCVIMVEITPERQYVIDSDFSGDECDYFDVVLSEEFDLSQNDVSWVIASNSDIHCFGRKPSITKI